MAKKKKAPEPTVLRTFNIESITYQQRLVVCGKDRCRKGCASGRASHGPYWYAVHWNAKTGKSKTVYIGKNEPTLARIEEMVNDK